MMKCAVKHRLAIFIVVVAHVFLENLLMLTKNILPVNFYASYIAKHYANIDKAIHFLIDKLKILSIYCHTRLDEEMIKIYIFFLNSGFVYSIVYLLSNVISLLLFQINPELYLDVNNDTTLVASFLIGLWITYKPHVDAEVSKQAMRYVTKYNNIHTKKHKDKK